MIPTIIPNRSAVYYRDIPALADESVRTVLAVRHSIRESLRGSIDPGLTDEGIELAKRCGGELAKLGDVSFGVSPRLRTRQTAQYMIEGGGFPVRPVLECPELVDTSIFEQETDLVEMLRTRSTEKSLREYYATGHTAGLKDLKPFGEGLAHYLTGTEFATDRTILVTHDVLIIDILMALDVRAFTPEDWCGYLHGVLLTQDRSGAWTAAYAVPDHDEGKTYRLFV